MTGASGFLGANIGLALGQGFHKIALSRDGAVPTHFDGAVSGVLQHPDEVARQVISLRPDVIIHAAAISSHELCESDPAGALLVNATATGILAHAAHEVGARFVYISTDAVFDGRRGNYVEADDPNPMSVYGHTKLAGEVGAQSATEALVIRTNFFGWSPSGHRSILEFFVDALSHGHQIRGFTDFTTSSAYAQDLARTIYRLVDSGAAGTFHVTSSDSMTKYSFGVAAAEEFGLDASLILPTAADIHPPRAGNISLDVSKVQGLLGHELPTMLEGIRRAREEAGVLRQRLKEPRRP